MDPDPDVLVLIATKTARVNESERWLDALAPIVGGAPGTLWHLVDSPPPGGPGPGHSHVIRLDSHSALVAYDAAIAAARAAADLPDCHAEVRRDVWVRHRRTLHDRTHVDPTAMIAAEVLCTDPTRVDEWDRWYDEQHLPDMMTSGAFVAGSRWRRSQPREGGANDLTLYEIAGIAVDEAIARSASVMPALIAAGRKHACHTGGPTMALSLVY